MNKHLHRLVFDHRRGMCVATSEHVRSSGKAGTGSTPGKSPAGATWRVVSALGLSGLVTATHAAPPIPKAAIFTPRAALPVRSTDAARTAGNWGTFSTSNPTATQLRVDQSSLRAIINWDSFNVAAGHKVQFVQPDKGSTLNKIWSADPSVVSGRIEANGEVILQNTNGVIFAPTARVETGRFVTTALRVAEETYKTGLRGTTDGSAAFSGDTSDTAGYVSLERGAEITTAAGGDVLIFAPRVVNEGRIETPDGQTVLGAGQTVYLAASADPAQRGLLVGIKPFAGTAGTPRDPDLNTVVQAPAQTYKTVNSETVPDTTAANTAGLVEKLNAIVAERGSINLVALAIRQNGLLQATTAVKGLNGSIQLLAQADVNPNAFGLVAGTLAAQPQTTALGTVSLGAGSVTQVLPEANNSATQLDSETFNRSRVRVEGEGIHVESGAKVRVPSGRIELLASEVPHQSLVFNPNSFDLVDHSRDSSRVVVGAGAVLDVAGLKDVPIAASRNQMSGRLFQIELADSPLQRDGVLYREEVFFDARKPPSIANVAGFYNTVARSAAELSTTGGSINIQADGGVAVDARAALDISGGSLLFEAGHVKTSLLRQGTQWVTLDKANKAVQYDELGNSKTRTDAGTATWRVEAVPSYVEGKNAGSATIVGRRTYFAGDVLAQAITGPAQDGRSTSTSVSTTPPQGGTLQFGRARVTDSALDSAVLQAGPARRRPGALFDDALQASVDDTLQPTLVVSANQLASAGLGSLKFLVAQRFAVSEGTQVQLAPGGSFQAQAGLVDLAGQIVVPAGRIEIITAETDAGTDAETDAKAPANITLGANAKLSTAGTWVDDSHTVAMLTAGAAPSSDTADTADTVALNGGSVVLTSAASLVAAPGAVVDVSAGARRAASAVTRGRAGSLTLAVNSGADSIGALPGHFDDWRGTLQGFDFDRGGSLAVSGLPSLTLGQPGINSNLDDQFFNGNGFGSISLSTLGDVKLAAALDLQLQLRNLLPLSAAGRLGEQGRFASVAVQPLAAQRAPVSLSITGSTAPNRLTGVPGSALRMEEGARIGTEAGGNLRLTARRQLTVDGELSAPGGAITLTLAGQRGGTVTVGVYDDNQGFDATQSLWLGSRAQLLVAGTDESSPDRLGRAVGAVFGGGSITLNAERGYVVAENGALLDLRGHTAELLTAAQAQPVQVSKSGGTLSISSAEGVHLAATVLAQATQDQTQTQTQTQVDTLAAGGSFSLNLSLNARERQTAGPAYSTAPRAIRITAGEPDALPPSLQAGQPLTAALANGEAELSNQLLQRAGFAQLELKADDRIVFDGNFTLAAPRAVVLNSPHVQGLADSEAQVQAAYVAMGDQRRSLRTSFETAPTASAGNATLRVDAGLIDLVGDMALQGFKLASLNATLDSAGGNSRRDGEVRLIGTARGLASQASGSLGFAGELQFTAGLTGATTLSTFTLEGLVGDSYFASYAPAGGSASGAALSAYGSLRLKADWIDLAGVMRQPFGRIEATADQLQVLDGAELSVASTDLTLPLGTTVNGSQWQYRATGLYRADGSAKPVDASSNADIRLLDAVPMDKAVVLNGQTLSLSPQARLSAAGGGHLQAWEFVAGVGGSADALAAPGLYAVLPDRRYEFAPFDAEIMSGAAAALRPGSQIEITQAGSALAPGRYTLLPARYGLLPGAVMVSLAPNQGRSPLTAALRNDDGGVVVSGAFTHVAVQGATSGTASETINETNRILVEPAATVLARSRIDITDIDELLQRSAERRDLPLPAAPSDAGRVALQASQPLRVDTRFELGNPSGGRRGELDIAVAGGAMAVVDDVQSPPAGDANPSLISAASLSNSQAGSVLLGGVRSLSADGSTVVVQPLANSVSLLATGSALEAAEVLLVATDTVTLAAGSRLSAIDSGNNSATNTVPRRVLLQGDAAHAGVSTHADLQVSHLYAAGAAQGRNGQLVVADGAAVVGQSVALGASFALQLGASADLQTGSLALAANRLALGIDAGSSALIGAGNSAGNAAQTTAVGVDLLQRFQQLDTLSLTASSGIDFYSALSLSLDRLLIDAPALRGMAGAAADGQAGPVVALQARDLTLRNSSSTVVTPDLGTGRGSLEVLALPVPTETSTGGLVLGGSESSTGTNTSTNTSKTPLHLAFDAVRLASTEDIVFSGSGLVQAQRDLTLSAARVTARSGADQAALAPAGTLRIESASNPGGAAGQPATTRGEQVGQGAALQFAAQIIEQAGVVQLPGGDLHFDATGLAAAAPALRFAPGSVTSAAGYSVTINGGEAAYGSAGRIVANAALGGIALQGLLDVSAPGTADAGSIDLRSTTGALTLGETGRLAGGSGAVDARQGRFNADAATLAMATSDGTATPGVPTTGVPTTGVPTTGDTALDRWAQALDAGQFHDTVAVRQRAGSLELQQATLRAQQVHLAADQGAITLNGSIDASAAAGGSVRLFAAADVVLNGRISAQSSRAGANGGDVQAGSSAGQVVLGAAAHIDTSGDDSADGRVLLRAPRDDDAGTVALRTAPAFNAGTQLQAGEVVVEGVRTYTGYTQLMAGAGNSADGGAALGQDQLAADQARFADTAAASWNQTALGQDTRATLRPAVQVLADGDFTLADTWNLADLSRPGVLTLRAAGNLRLLGSLSDGFAAATRPWADSLSTPTALLEGPAWSMRLVAGADTAAADPLALRSGAAANLTLANEQWVRTTSGSIEMAAARDVRFGSGGANSQQGVVMVTGRPSEVMPEWVLAGSAWTPQFTSHGGALTVLAGRDVVGAPAGQLSSAWFFHTGALDQTAVAWWSAFDAFRLGLGSFGGGAVRVQAGRDVLNLGVVSPTAAQAAEPVFSSGADQGAATRPSVANGGDIQVDAGGHISGGTYFLGRGTGRLTAGGAIKAAAPLLQSVPATGPLLALMDGAWHLSSRGAAEVAGVYNPTLLPSANRDVFGMQRLSDLDAGAYFTYSDNSAVSVSSHSGVAWLPDRLPPQVSGTGNGTGDGQAAPGMAAYWDTLASSGPATEQAVWSAKFLAAVSYLPPQLHLQALGGDLTLALPGFSSGLTLFPSSSGQLSMLARDDIRLVSTANRAGLVLSDQTPASLPSVFKPAAGVSNETEDYNVRTLSTVSDAIGMRFDGVHADTGRTPVRLQAGGDIDLRQQGRAASVALVAPAPAHIEAGGDILGLSLLGQHSNAQEVTTVQAGGSILQGSDTSARITLAGPGTLALSAGRQLDLGASQGVETVGNLYNNQLPAQGADLVLAAGTRATLDTEQFAQRYLGMNIGTGLDDAGPGAAGGNTVQAQAEALANAYLVATDRDLQALDAGSVLLRSQLTLRFGSQIALWGGGDAQAVAERRAQLVADVRLALGLPLLPAAQTAAQAAAAFTESWALFKTLSAPTQVQTAEKLLNTLFAQRYLAPGQAYAQRWLDTAAAAGADPERFSGPAFDQVKRDVLFQEFNLAGTWAAALPSSASSTRAKTYNIGFMAADLAGLGNSYRFAGDLDMVASGVLARNGGRITLLAPGGQINVGLPGTGSTGSALGLKGAVGYGSSGISAYADQDFQVNSQRVFVVGQGDITIWSSRGNIDAGRGANTSITVPPLVAVRQADGSIRFALPSLAVGSGIGILQPAVGQAVGDIGLFAPNGEVRALDAQIRAPGRITLAAEVVRGADNISGGSVAGAPVVVPAVPLSLPTAAPSAGETLANSGAGANNGASAQTRERNGLLMVELLGLGLAPEEDCGNGRGSAQDKAQQQLECERRKKAGPVTASTAAGK